ncbi:MAG: hypothetical protein KGH57_03510 [Candidatus Micrarchaeota archaeon]|nr:hypothetical protein [Candidatus Micrarchaeota archaeon]
MVSSVSNPDVRATPTAGKKGGGIRYVISGLIVLLVIGVISFFAISSYTPPQPTTTASTTIKATTTAPPPLPFTFNSILLASNALYGFPQQPQFTDYYFNFTNAGWAHSQYAVNFTYPLFTNNFTPPANYTVSVPARYSNLTSPFASIISVWAYATASSAAQNFPAVGSTMCRNLNATGSMRTVTSAIGSVTTYCSGTLYGSSTEGVLFNQGNVSAEVIFFGVLQKLNPSYLNTTARHLYLKLTQ